MLLQQKNYQRLQSISQYLTLSKAVTQASPCFLSLNLHFISQMKLDRH